MNDLIICEIRAFPEANLRRTSAKAELTHRPEFDLSQAACLLAERMHHHDRCWNENGVPAQALHESLEQQLCNGEVGDQRSWMGEGVVNGRVRLRPRETSG